MSVIPNLRKASFSVRLTDGPKGKAEPGHKPRGLHPPQEELQPCCGPAPCTSLGRAPCGGKAVKLFVLSAAAVWRDSACICQVNSAWLDPAPPCSWLRPAARALLPPGLLTRSSLAGTVERSVSEGLPALPWEVNVIVKGCT